MAFNLNTGQAVYQKTEIFDTAGNHTWTHPLPGQNIEVFVEMFGGGGGSINGLRTATQNGEDTVWDTAGANETADGGTGGGTDGNGMQVGDKGLYSGTTAGAVESSVFTNGSNSYGASVNNIGYPGNVGDVKRFNQIVTNDINFTVGAGGTGDQGNGKAGAVIISYNITTTQTPVIANLQRRDWEHFGEISWRTAASASSQSITADTLTTLTIDTEVLDTGNKIQLDGSNLFTLQPGTYEVDIKTTLSTTAGSDCVFRLYNVSDSSIPLSLTVIGGSGYSTHPNMIGHIVVPSTKQFKLEITTGENSSIGDNGGGSGKIATSDLADRTKFQFKWRP